MGAIGAHYVGDIYACVLERSQNKLPAGVQSDSANITNLISQLGKVHGVV